MPLRILHVVSAPAAGGAEIYVKQLALELRRRGHRPAIGFVGSAAEAHRNIDFERRYLEELDRAAIDYFFIGHASRWNPLLGAWKAWKFCRANGIQIYHSHLKSGLIFGAFVGIPRLTTHHNSITKAPLWVYRLFNLIVDQYVGISESCGRLLNLYTGRPVEVIRNGIDLSKFTASVRNPRETDIIRPISVGRIFPQKNYPLLVSAIALLPSKARKRIHLAIAGEGSGEAMADLQRQISAAGLGDCITLLGNRNDVPALLEGADLLLMSSAWEGFPIALLEATASGLPFVATDVGGCREVADLCGNGVLVTPGDPQALADAIADLIDNPATLQKLSKAAVESAANLSIEVAADAHLDLYRRLLAQRNARLGGMD
jgi:glycosyltransferase involved in cell wall biosynthesis